MKKFDYPIVLVEWEDIVSHTRVELPTEFKDFRLIKQTIGFLYKTKHDFIVVVPEYDYSNKGKDYAHSDFTLIPKGCILKIVELIPHKETEVLTNAD